MKKLIFTLAALSMSHAYADECASNETLIASCTLSGELNRIAFFCADLQSDTIKYTFKKGGVSELTVDFNSQRKLKRWVDFGTHTTYLGFSLGKYSYVLSVPEERLGIVAQLDVKKDNEVISSKQCDSNSFGEEGIKMNSIEDVQDSSVRDNGFEFP